MRLRLRGFTLIEILIVITLLGILIFFSLIFFPAQFAKARDAERKANLNKVGKYIEDYYTDTDCYPLSIPLCGGPLKLGEKIYISDLPCDPETGDSYVYVSEISFCPSWFQLYGNLEYTKDTIIDKVGCRNGCGPECQFNYGIASSNVRLNFLCQDSNIVSTPEEVPEPTPGSPSDNLQYVCAPGGECELFAHPELSGCPDIYLNDPTCQDNPCKDPKYRCHDARGKTN